MIRIVFDEFELLVLSRSVSKTEPKVQTTEKLK